VVGSVRRREERRRRGPPTAMTSWEEDVDGIGEDVDGIGEDVDAVGRRCRGDGRTLLRGSVDFVSPSGGRSRQ
jgi:hypothetical protein